MYTTNHPIVLASSSPRRQQFLQWLGLDYEIHSTDIDESHRHGESPREYACRLATEKGKAIANRFPSAYIISADTIVTLDDTIFGKPENPDAAVIMLMQLSGRTHTVLSAYSIIGRQHGVSFVDAISTDVTFIPFSEEVAKAYVATGEPLDKAGAYGIQQSGVALVKKVNGSYSNVVGLPLAEVINVLVGYGAVSCSAVV